MDSGKLEDIIYDYRFLLRAARILGTFELIMLFYLSLNEFREEIQNNSTSPLLTMINGQYFLAVTLTITFIGLIIAYWKEGLGGGISLASLILLFIVWSDFHVSLILGMGIVSVPSVLYVAYRISVHLALRNARQNQTTDH